MDWKILKRWFRDYFIIVLVTMIASLFLNHYVEFSEDTLLWMTSTIAQAFGALIAIVIAIGLFEKQRTMSALGKLLEKNFDKKEKVIRLTDDEREYFDTLSKAQKSLWSRLYYPIQSIAVLIAVSLVVMMFIKSSFVWNNYVKTFFFIFLVLFAIYTLEVLINELSKVFR